MKYMWYTFQFESAIYFGHFMSSFNAEGKKMTGNKVGISKVQQSPTYLIVSTQPLGHQGAL